MEKNDKKFWMGETENEEQFLEELLKKFEAAKETHRLREIHERCPRDRYGQPDISQSDWEWVHKNYPGVTKEEAAIMFRDAGA